MNSLADSLIPRCRAMGTRMCTWVSTLMNNGYLPKGLMIGFSPAVFICFGSPDINPFVSFGALFCFLGAAAAYTRNNQRIIVQFGLQVGIAILAIVLIIFPITTARPVDILRCSPTYITLVLISAVNVAIPVADGLHKGLEAVSAIMAVIRSLSGALNSTGPDIDLEAGFLRDTPGAEDGERPARNNDLPFLTGNSLPGPAAMEEGDREELELDNLSATTTPEVRNWLEMIWTPVRGSSPD